MGNINLIFGLITVGCGIYCLYLWIKIRVSKQVPDGCIILPRGSTLDECIDAEEFLRRIMPRLLIFAVLILFFGLVFLADTYFGLIDKWTAAYTASLQLLILELVTCIIPFGVVIWFGICLYRVQKQLW